MKSIESPTAGDQVLDDVRVGVEELRRHEQVGRDVLPVRPEVLLVDEDLAAAFGHEAGRVRLGHPRTVDLARLERVDRLRVVLRQDLHVTTAGRVGLVALRLQPGAQRDVLGVAELRRRQGLALEVRRGDIGLHDQVGAARSGAGHDAHRGAVRLRIRVDRRVGTDERRVERATEDRLDGRGAGVEDRRLDGHVVAERFGEFTVLDADDGRRVRGVREVTEPQRDGLAADGRGAVAPRRGVRSVAAVVIVAPARRKDESE